MFSVLFEGEKHKITTDGRNFFLYLKSIKNQTKEVWELLSQNTFEGEMYEEALRDVKKVLSAGIPEDEKILKICESGFFKIA